ncbi:glycosyltransferase [Stenotrophomonas sp. BIGb0135]|jgi:glycosyltransferase involved in cell wall biosynthesis|uniref:glycosyltransferase n=1 Tax=Stenotrophomonas sp. BIGb0135 TaxID=2940620 RepID=UPI0021673F4A|nr:glycosyltransferase [Stenotrophomonas sp. BIGb0135]MCS4236877.1 glycosyltransferase involved in cell wall biosynthesis [Stenotrophomonas sp. BIGb0135]
MIAVIVPAHNEVADIGRCLAAINVAGAHPRLQGEPVLAVVALDDCSDGTEAVAASFGAATLTVDARCVGAARAAAANHALALGARWIASTDADTLVPPEWVWKQTRCGADAFCGVVDVVDWLDYPQAVREAFACREVARDGHGHVHGANLGVSAAAYLAAGGFAALATGEDVALVQALQRSRASIAWHARPAVATSARRAAKAPQGFSGFLRALEREVLDAGTALLPTPALLR